MTLFFAFLFDEVCIHRKDSAVYLSGLKPFGTEWKLSLHIKVAL